MVCSFILLTLAFGKKKVLSKLSKALASELDSIGSLIFLAIATLGMSIGGVFFGNFIQKNIPGREFALLSAGMIPLCNIAIAIKVGSSLFMVFIILAVLRVVEKEGRLEMIQTEMREDE
jgi:multicomponent Na+:H+ antiporter subunit B